MHVEIHPESLRSVLLIVKTTVTLRGGDHGGECSYVGERTRVYLIRGTASVSSNRIGQRQRQNEPPNAVQMQVLPAIEKTQ